MLRNLGRAYTIRVSAVAVALLFLGGWSPPTAAAQSDVQIDVTYSDCTHLQGGGLLSLGLTELPTAINARFIYSGVYPPLTGNPISPTVTYAAITIGDAHITADDLQVFTVGYQKPEEQPLFLSVLSYFGFVDETGTAKSIEVLNSSFEINIKGTDTASGVFFHYRCTTSTQTFAGPLCGATPAPDGACRLAEPGGGGKSLLLLKNKAEDTKDLLKWKWKKGVATDMAAFRFPDTSTASYRLCLYDAGGKVADLDLPPGGVVPTCGTKPCWKATGKGFSYKNKAGGPSGITVAKLKVGEAGKAQVLVKVTGKGGNYTSPATDTLTPPVVAQLLIDDGSTTECFKTTFPGTSGVGVIKKQDAESFKAKGP